MRIIEQAVMIMTPFEFCGASTVMDNCYVARKCYNSTSTSDYEKNVDFIRRLIKNGHEAMIEHVSFTAEFVTSRGIANEIVRHRMASYAQQSTRYCDYADGKKYPYGVEFVNPFIDGEVDSRVKDVWEKNCKNCEADYLYLRTLGVKPQIAREVLNTSTATVLIMTANMREWRHFFKLRTAKDAHPLMQKLSSDLLVKAKRLFLPYFEDLGDEGSNWEG